MIVLLLIGLAGAALLMGGKSSPSGGPDGLVGNGNGKNGTVPGPDKGRPGRMPLWSAERLVTATLEVPGWSADVRQSTKSWYYCGAHSFSESASSYDESAPGGEITCKDDGRGMPIPHPFEIRIVDAPALATVISCDIAVSDADGVTARERVRTSKATDGRRAGRLDVNEVELEGAPRETGYCERVARIFDGGVGREYMTRRPIECGIDLTPVQPYQLYRAKRETTPEGSVRRIYEYFAKVKQDPAYPKRAPIPDGPSYYQLYNLQLIARDGSVFLIGEIAASLSPLKLDVRVVWKMRPVENA